MGLRLATVGPTGSLAPLGVETDMSTSQHNTDDFQYAYELINMCVLPNLSFTRERRPLHYHGLLDCRKVILDAITTPSPCRRRCSLGHTYSFVFRVHKCTGLIALNGQATRVRAQ